MSSILIQVFCLEIICVRWIESAICDTLYWLIGNIFYYEVIAGEAKGCPRSASVLRTRPATELVRGAIFSILYNVASDWRLVLDLFSGSGSLGIEALSRGAGWVDFVEQTPRCCAIIKQNLEKTRFTEYAHVHCADVVKAISFLDKEYNIILMDPPVRSVNQQHNRTTGKLEDCR